MWSELAPKSKQRILVCLLGGGLLPLLFSHYGWNCQSIGTWLAGLLLGCPGWWLHPCLWCLFWWEGTITTLFDPHSLSIHEQVSRVLPTGGYAPMDMQLYKLNVYGKCYGTRSRTYLFHSTFNTVYCWFTAYLHCSCYLLFWHFSLCSLVVNFPLWFPLLPNRHLSPKPMTHRFIPLLTQSSIVFQNVPYHGPCSAFHRLPGCSIPWSVHILETYKYCAILYY